MRKRKKHKKLVKLIRKNPGKFKNMEKIPWFIEWLAINPSVYHDFVTYALALRSRNPIRTYGARAIAEKLRFDYEIAGVADEEGYMISNSAVPYMSRLSMIEYPKKLKGLFSIRVRVVRNLYVDEKGKIHKGRYGY